ncbi:MAG TPA: AAA family ATPase [Syntrophales bacterium]|nr:AAA family ATPase [Syntrophales bacterium]
MIDYKQFYGFSASPFNLSTDPKFFFPSESHREALAALLYGINERKGFILILGEKGVGKTAVIHKLITMYHLHQSPYFGLLGKTDMVDRVSKTLGYRVKTIFFPRGRITFEQMLKEILYKLDLPLRDEAKGSMMHELYYYLIQCLERNENVVIIIDDAHDISLDVIEELRLLSNLETSKSKLLQIVLVGQPELRTKLCSEVIRQIRQRIVINYEICPLTEEESMDYINHRLKIAGSKSSQVFTDEALSSICRYAKGIPRVINVLCSNALDAGYGLSEKRISSATVKQVQKERDASIQEVDKIKTPVLKRNPLRKISYAFLALAVFMAVIFFGKNYPLNVFKTQDTKNFIEQPVIKNKGKAPASGAQHRGISKADMITTGTEVESFQPKPQASALSRADLTGTDIPVKKVIEVHKGANLSLLALKYYNEANPTLVDHIWEINPEIVNPNLILVSQKIKIPEITESLLIRQSSDGSYKVYLGTFLNRQDAARYKNYAALREKNIEILPRKISQKETWFRVTAGPFESREEGLKTVEALRDKGLLPSFPRLSKKDD